MCMHLPFSPFPNRLGEVLLGRDKTQRAGMSHPRAFCSPNLGLDNAAKCSTSPPAAAAIRTWGFFCYFFVAVCCIWVCFKNAWQSLRDFWGYFHLLRNFSLCHSSCPRSGVENCFSPEFSHSVLDSSHMKKSEKLLNLNQQCLYLKIVLQTMPFFPVAGKLTCAYRRDYKQKKNEVFGQILGGR